MFANKMETSKKIGNVHIHVQEVKVTLQSNTLEMRSLNQDNYDVLIDNYTHVLGKAENVALLQDGKTWSKERVSDLITEMQREQNQGSYFGFFSVYQKTNNQFIGSLNLRKVFNEYEHVGKGHKNAVEMGYFIDQAYWGKGYGTQMAIMGKKYIKFLSSNHLAYNISPKPEEIVATVHPENQGSLKILQNTFKNQEQEQLIKFGGNPRLFFYKPINTKKDNPVESTNLTAS